MTVNLLDLANMLSVSVDLMEDGVYHHGQRVALAYRIFQGYTLVRMHLTGVSKFPT